MPNKVVVTGFGAFGVHERNPSADVAKALATSPPSDCIIHTEELRVAYDEVSDAVPRLWEEHDPDLIIHIGVHPERECIKLERQSFPDGYCREDVDGRVPNDNCCTKDIQNVLKCGIDLDGVVAETREAMAKGEIPSCVRIETSDDPGRYLCGFSYFLSLAKDNTKALFIHIPVVDEEKGVTIDAMARIVACVIETIFKGF